MEDYPLVSIVIPCYNQAEYLEAALHSVLAQSKSNWEVIIVNDGSTDDTRTTAERFIDLFPGKPIRLVNKVNGGLASARNAGVKASNGEFILPLDADDMLHPLYLERTVHVLHEKPELGYVYVVAVCFGDEHKIWTGGGFEFNKLLEQNLMTCTTLFRKQAWIDAGGYNTNMKHGFEDWDLWVSMGEKGWMGQFVPEPLFLYRKHGQTMLKDTYDKYEDWSKARLMLNHPGLYPPELVERSRELLKLAEEIDLSTGETDGRKILFFHYEKPISPVGVNAGAEMALIHTARALVRKGNQVSVAGYLKDPPGEYQGVRYIDTGAEYDFVRVLSEIAGDYDVIIASARADVLEESLKYDNLQLRVLYLQIDQLAAVKRSPSVIKKVADLVICVSEAHKKAMVSQGIDPEMVEIVHNCSDPDMFYPMSDKRDDYRIAYAGALVPVKGVHNLINAFVQIRQKYPQAKLDIYGSADMWSESEYIDAANNDPAQSGLELHGKVPQDVLAEAFSRSSLMVVPSLLARPDPHPLTPMDAQSCECPAMVTPSGGLPECVEDGVTGFVLPDDSVESLIKGLDDALSNTERLRKMGKAARVRILNGFTWGGAAEKLTKAMDISIELKSLSEYRSETPKETPKIEVNSLQKMIELDSIERKVDSDVRVGFISTYNQKCGLATYAGYLLEHYNPANTFILAEYSDDDREGVDEPNVYRCWKRRNIDYNIIEKIVYEKKIDVLHVNYQMAFFPGDHFPKLLQKLRENGVKVAASYHATDGSYMGYIWMDQAADAVLVHMPYNYTQLAAVGCDVSKVHVIPHGIPEFPPMDREQIRQELGAPPELRLYISFGFVEPHKGIAENIRALKNLQGKFPFMYVILGGAHPKNPIGKQYIEECRQLVKDLEMEDCVQFMVDYIPFEQLRVMMEASDAIIMNYQSNRYETSGAAALALSSKAPVITSNAPPFADLQREVLKITENNPLDIIMMQLAGNSEIRAHLNRERERLLKERSWKNTARQIKSIYHDLLSGGGGVSPHMQVKQMKELSGVEV